MMFNPYDQACRFSLKQFSRPLVAWLLGLRVADVDFRQWLDTRNLPWPGSSDRFCDTVAHLCDRGSGGVPWAIPFEFQIDPDTLMFGRGLEYLGGMWQVLKPSSLRGDRFQVGLVVVNLRGVGRCSRRMRLAGTHLGTTLNVVERNFSRVKGARVLRNIESGRTPAEVLPWFPLFQGGCEPGMITKWLEVAQRQTDDNLRRALPLAVLFAEAVKGADLWREALKGWDVMESQVVKEWTELARRQALEQGLQQGLETGRQQGLEAGRQQGLQQAKVENLLLVLRMRPQLGLSPELEQAVRALTDTARLDAALAAALTASSVEEFRRLAAL